MDLSRQLTGRCPVFHRGLAFGCRFGAAGLKSIARNFNAPCFRLSLRRGQAEIHCPKLQRGTTSVHGFVAAAARALPAFSPRSCLGCRSGAVGLKSIARNFNAALLRLSLRRGGTKNRCPLFHCALASVVAPARPDRKLLPETSTRHYFGAWICRGS